MPGKRKSSYAHDSAKRTKRPSQRRTKYVRMRRKGAARPSRALSTGFKGRPNQYRFVRETRPTIVDIGNNLTPGVTIIPGTGSIPDISAFQFPGFQINQLTNFVTEFAPLFANFKIDRIETVLIPQWQETVNPDGAGSGTTQLSNLMMTRVNTKWLIGGLDLLAAAEDMRDKLAQIQKKSRSLYGTRKWLKINTSNPYVGKVVPDGSGGDNNAMQPSPWMDIANSSDQEYQFNDTLFADRLDGKPFVTGVYLYRMYHRVHFRTSFVG